MKKNVKTLLAFLLTLCILMLNTVSVLAQDNEEITNIDESEIITEEETNSEKVSWDSLPEAYQEIIDKGAIIYKNNDGTYDIYQEKPLEETVKTARTVERYAPKGGTYSKFSNSSYGSSKLITLIYQTYLPSDVVGKYLVQNKTTVLNSAKQWTAAYGISKALYLLAKKFKINIKEEVLNLAVSSAITYFTSYNYNQILNVSGGGKYGVQIDYITTIGSGNSRVYSKWTNAPYVLLKPNGGSASWASGKYYAKP